MTPGRTTAGAVQPPLPLDVAAPLAPVFVPLPRGLLPATPDGMSVLDGSLARQDVLARTSHRAAAGRLLALGLAQVAGGGDR